MPDPTGVTVPPALAGQVADWILAGVRGELLADRDRRGRPFPAAPFIGLVHALRAAARTSAAGSDCWTSPPALLSTTATARHMGVSPRRVRQLAASGRLPARRTARGDWQIYREGLPR